MLKFLLADSITQNSNLADTNQILNQSITTKLGPTCGPPYALVQITPASWVPTQPELNHLTDLLGDQERQRLNRLGPRKHHEFLISRGLLRHLLSHSIGQKLTPKQWTIKERRDLPPHVIEASQYGIHFSISHSAGRVAVAISRHVTVGVDIEYPRTRDYLTLAQMACHPDEVAALKSTPAKSLPSAFYRLWTLTEASLKLRLLGLGSGMTTRLRLHNPSGEINRLTSPASFIKMNQLSLAIATSQPAFIQLTEGIPGSDQITVLSVKQERVLTSLPASE